MNVTSMQMNYPYKYPELYGELARQGKSRKELAQALGISVAGLRYKQARETNGDFNVREIRAAAAYLQTPADALFGLESGEKP